MSLLSGRKLLILGFIFILLIAIPVLIWFLQQQQETRSRAEKSTVISFQPVSSQTAPLQKKVGDTVSVDVMVDPGNNLVSFVKLEVQYDPTKIATDGATPFVVDAAAFPSTLEGPTYTPGKITATLSVGADSTKVIQGPNSTKIATITFKAIAPTDSTPTSITHGAQTKVLTIAGAEQTSEDVLSSATPAFISISGSAKVTETPTPTTEPSGAPTVTPTTKPTLTLTPAPSGTASPTLTPTGIGSSNQAPDCESFVADRSTTGTAPFAISFTVTGSDPDGTINKATFNFGDGPVQTLTETGGLGSNSVSVQTSHTYNAAGTYQATATLTDNQSGVSAAAGCSLTVTVNAAGGTGSSSTAEATQEPTIAATGPGDIFLGLGAFIGLLSIVGGLLFFVL